MGKRKPQRKSQRRLRKEVEDEIMKMVISLVLIFLLVTVAVLSENASAQSGQTNPSFSNHNFKYDGIVSLSAEYPYGWDVDKNVITSTGWIASFYDSIENWEIQVDLSAYKVPNELLSMKDDQIMEYTFLSYYYACGDTSFTRTMFDRLPGNVIEIVYEKFASESEDPGNLSALIEWWSSLYEYEISEMFENKGIDESKYKEGYECSEFTPIDFKIMQVGDYQTYQYVYSWIQTFPDGTYFENVNVETDVWVKKFVVNVNVETDVLIKTKNLYIVNLSGETTLDNHEKHLVEYEDIIESLIISEKPSFSQSILPQWVKIDAGLWSLNSISDTEFKNAVEFVITNQLVQKPTVLDTDVIISSIPDWLKNIAGWLSQNEISEADFINSITHLCNEKLIICEAN